METGISHSIDIYNVSRSQMKTWVLKMNEALLWVVEVALVPFLA